MVIQLHHSVKNTLNCEIVTTSQLQLFSPNEFYIDGNGGKVNPSAISQIRQIKENLFDMTFKKISGILDAFSEHFLGFPHLLICSVVLVSHISLTSQLQQKNLLDETM